MLTGAIEARAESDRRFYFLTDGILIPIITLGIWNLVMMYRLIKRRDAHFRQMHGLNRVIVDTIKEKARANNVDPTSLPGLADLETAIRTQEEKEQAKGAALWLILSMVTGIAGLYVQYFLTVDFYHHEQRQKAIVDKANDVLASANLPGRMQYNAVLPERHFWLNFLATIVTLGIWGIFWQYRIYSDPNRHFESEWVWEDSITPALV
jgi:flagellar biosynthesis regulator FlaF